MHFLIILFNTRGLQLTQEETNTLRKILLEGTLLKLSYQKIVFAMSTIEPTPLNTWFSLLLVCLL